MMRSSMFSPAKKEDKELLLEIAELIEALVRLGVHRNNSHALDLAEQLGHDYLHLQEKIKTKDYSEIDRLYEKIDEYDSNLKSWLRHDN